MSDQTPSKAGNPGPLGAPMTPDQRQQLQALCGAAGVSFDEHLDQAAAAARIAQLQRTASRPAPAADSELSVAGEEDPGAGLDMPERPNPAA